MPVTSSSTFLNQSQVPVTRAVAATPAAAVPAGQSKQLGKQDFLKLLMAQLSNQDPMKPMDDTQMIAQMAQFSALEATQSLKDVVQQSSNTQTISSAAALIGKYIRADQADTTTINGAVTGVKFETTNGSVTPIIQVDGTDVNYSTINQISSTPIPTS
jgi:flagellar basal-body rod modification protein FlgD